MNEILLNRASHPSTPPYAAKPRDRRNPDVWDALYADQEIPIDSHAKAFMIQDLQNWTRHYLLVPIKMMANLLLAMILTIKHLLPWQFSSYGLMHRLATWFLNTFVTPEACYLIVRHFSLESNIINFLIDNGPDITLEKSTLYPVTVTDLAENLLMEHDFVFYNFILDYANSKQDNQTWLTAVQTRGINYASLQSIEVNIEGSRNGVRCLDLESTLELFKIIYAVCLTPAEFERAAISLAMDENIAIYINILFNNLIPSHLIFNRHPLAPKSLFSAARCLLLHGLFVEYLHHYLAQCSEKAVQG
jgi:hypothetical protein